ncbi:MAG: hypothetical protein VYC34_10710 [Planctomycetota bacterium]|nr:hypothetical protein [Planctomycetota bacterium]
MPRYIVRSRHPKGGGDQDVVIDAPTETDARRAVEGMGLEPLTVLRLAPPEAASAPAAARGPQPRPQVILHDLSPRAWRRLRSTVLGALMLTATYTAALVAFLIWVVIRLAFFMPPA